MEIFIISGRSGSGKSITINLLEDLGFYCIDNLPANLLPLLIENLVPKYHKLAIGIDARNLPNDFEQFHCLIERLKALNNKVQVLYLDAENLTLIQRFNETRRKHPLTHEKLCLADAIEKEKDLLKPIAELTDLYIDTTHYNVHQLRETLTQRILQNDRRLSLLIQSFGYKYGIPTDSDYTFDVRCLANPYWLPELRQYSGLEQPIEQFLSAKPETMEMLQDIIQFIDKWVPHFEQNDRAYLTLSIGCTGGYHRSVFMAEKIYAHLKDKVNAQIRHRELL